MLGDKLSLGETLGDMLGEIDGDKLGLSEGDKDGDKLELGLTDGLIEGDRLGLILGDIEGDNEGDKDEEGLTLGDILGLIDGEADGLIDGDVEPAAFGSENSSQYPVFVPEAPILSFIVSMPVVQLLYPEPYQFDQVPSSTLALTSLLSPLPFHSTSILYQVLSAASAILI